MMSKGQEKVLKKYMDKWLDQIITSLNTQKGADGPPSTASGQSANEFHNTFSKNGATMFGPSHTVNLEYGREAGKMPPVQPLIEWARIRGFSDPESAGWGIAIKIKNEGTKWNRQHKRSGLVTDIITKEEISLLTKELAQVTNIEVFELLKDALKV